MAGTGPPRRAFTPASGGWTSAGPVDSDTSFRGVDLAPALENRGDGGGDGGGGRRSLVAEQSPTPATVNRPNKVTTGVRRRFGGDIRQYAVHTKCD